MADNVPSIPQSEPITDYFKTSTSYLPSSSNSRHSGESPSESSAMGAMQAANAYAYADSFSFQKETPPTSISSGGISPENLSTEREHPIKEIAEKNKASENQGAKNSDFEKEKAAKKQKDEREKEKFMKNFEAGQQDGRCMSVLDPDYLRLRADYQAGLAEKKRYLKEHPEEAQKEVERKRDKFKNLFFKWA
jgi:hypothetical protein